MRENRRFVSDARNGTRPTNLDCEVGTRTDSRDAPPEAAIALTVFAHASKVQEVSTYGAPRDDDS